MIPFLSVKMGKSILEYAPQILKRVAEFTHPVIIFHGKADLVTNYLDSKKFVETNMTAWKRLHVFENGFH